MKPKISHLFLPFILLCFYCASAQESTSENLLVNPSFENGSVERGKAPDLWGLITESAEPVNGGLTDSAAHTGKYPVFLDKPANGKDKWEVLASNISIQSGDVYKFSAWIKSDPKNPLKRDARGAISIEWKDADGEEISRAVSDPWTAKTLQVSQDWIEVKIEAVAPPKTQSATFAITYFDGNDKDAGGAFLIDDVVAVKIK